MSRIEDVWTYTPEHQPTQWASLWLTPDRIGLKPIWPFTVAEVVERLNEWLDCLGADFQFSPDPTVSNDHYVAMRMRDHTQAFAVAMLGRMAAQTLLDEKG
jgi:alkanesulfonate monooxygenase SsuD/methylene tetrahydromethanopterin reductase-like flavin-dependent oxidoreductase (luciferase family)